MSENDFGQYHNCSRDVSRIKDKLIIFQRKMYDKKNMSKGYDQWNEYLLKSLKRKVYIIMDYSENEV